MGRNVPPIRIPPELTASSFRQRLKGQFSLIAKHSGEIHWDAHFEPPTGIDRVVVEIPRLNRFTAEGLCDLLGLLEWMKSENKVPIVVKGKDNLPRQDSVSRSGDPTVGVSPKVVSEQLGHTSAAFTLDVYSHVLPHMQDDAAAKVEAALQAH